MITYRLADLPIGLCHKNPPRPASLLDYQTDEAPLFSCEVSEGEIESMMHELSALRGGEAVNPAFCETFALYLAIAERLPLHGGFMLHSVLLSIDGEGVAILAPSGVGKSTLACNLIRALPDRVRIINGDKPLVRRKEDGIFYGYGTPFCGKEGWYEKSSVPIKRLILLRRAAEDSVTKMRRAEAFPRLFEAIHPPKTAEARTCLPSLLSDLLGSTECYDAALTKGESAAACVLRALYGKEIPT